MNDSADPYMVYLGANIDNQKEIFWDTRLNPHAFATGKTGSGVSFFHRMIMSHTLKHQEDWNFVGIDPTKVELSDCQDYEDAVYSIAIETDDIQEILSDLIANMNSTYKKMEEEDAYNVSQLEDKVKSNFVLVTDIDKTLKSIRKKSGPEAEREAKSKFTQISTLGRGAGIHLVVMSKSHVPTPHSITNRLSVNLTQRVHFGKIKELDADFIGTKPTSAYFPPRSFKIPMMAVTTLGSFDFEDVRMDPVFFKPIER